MVALHGFPLDWNHWKINDWPKKLAEIRAVTDLPIWVTEVGVSTFGADEVQVFGLKRTAELLLGAVGGGDEAVQAAQAQERAQQTQATGTLLSEDQVGSHLQAVQEVEPGGGLASRNPKALASGRCI